MEKRARCKDTYASSDSGRNADGRVPEAVTVRQIVEALARLQLTCQQIPSFKTDACATHDGENEGTIKLDLVNAQDTATGRCRLALRRSRSGTEHRCCSSKDRREQHREKKKEKKSCEEKEERKGDKNRETRTKATRKKN